MPLALMVCVYSIFWRQLQPKSLLCNAIVQGDLEVKNLFWPFLSCPDHPCKAFLCQVVISSSSYPMLLSRAGVEGFIIAFSLASLLLLIVTHLYRI